MHAGERPDRAQADQYELRGGCGGLRRSTQCTVVPEIGRSAEGAEDPHLRRIWIHRHRGVQLARHFEADVTAVCSTKNLELVRSLGADRVIDYTQEDFTRNGQTYDVIFDAVGKHSFNRCKGSLNRGGSYLATDGLQNLILALWTSRFGDKKVMFKIPPRYTKKDILFLKELIEAGRYRAVIDRCYPIEDVVEATRYVETEQKTGNVVLTINGGPAQ